MNKNDILRRLYKPLSLGAAILFAVVGLVFLLMSKQVLTFFNFLAYFWGLPQSPSEGFGFYVILTTAYMYLVTVLAYLMYRYPEEKLFPFLLAHGKIMSSFLSLAAFFFHQRYLIYISNCIIDGFIGIVAFYMYCQAKELNK